MSYYIRPMLINCVIHYTKLYYVIIIFLYCMCIPYVLYYMGGRIIDSLQIDSLQIDNRQIDNLQIDNRQIDNLTFSKIDSAIPLPCPRGLGNWHHGVVGVRLGLIEVR